MITIQRMGDQEQLTSTMPDGSPLKYEVPDKGGVGKFIAGPYDGVSEKRTDDTTRDITWMKGGKEMLHFHAVVSKDGKTMRITSKGINARAILFPVWQSGKNNSLGQWERSDHARAEDLPRDIGHDLQVY